MTVVPKAAVDLVKRFEGCKLTAYKCPANVWTIGYGQTGPDIVEGVTWTAQQAEDRLKTALGKFAATVDGMVKVPLTDNQRAALISFVYNIGGGALKSSTLLSLLNQGRTAEAADQFPKWNKGGGRVLGGLTVRRAAERELFLKKD
jgi:lysozyme